MNNIQIIGCGLAGLLAGNLLSHREPTLIERQSELPNNHSAVLRFRSSAVGDATGIPFKRVTMAKASLPWMNPIADCLVYSFKNTGVRRSDRSITEGFVTAERFIAPPDFVNRLASPIKNRIKFGAEAEFVGPGPWISTIPMPDLAKLLDYPHQDELHFETIPGTNVRARVANTDAYVSLLVPNPEYAFSRVTLTGNELIVETPFHFLGSNGHERDAVIAAELLGIPENALSDITIHRSSYQKLLPMEESARRRALHWFTDKKGVYSLGRYATARPGLLMDSLIQDIRLISGWIDSGSYDMMKRR